VLSQDLSKQLTSTTKSASSSSITATSTSKASSSSSITTSSTARSKCHYYIFVISLLWCCRGIVVVDSFFWDLRKFTNLFFDWSSSFWRIKCGKLESGAWPQSISGLSRLNLSIHQFENFHLFKDIFELCDFLAVCAMLLMWEGELDYIKEDLIMLSSSPRLLRTFPQLGYKQCVHDNVGSSIGNRLFPNVLFLGFYRLRFRGECLLQSCYIVKFHPTPTMSSKKWQTQRHVCSKGISEISTMSCA